MARAHTHTHTNIHFKLKLSDYIVTYLRPEQNCAVRGPVDHSLDINIDHISLALYGNSK